MPSWARVDDAARAAAVSVPAAPGSLPDPPQIAREEMGHLATVQNLLHLIGGPLNLNRDHSPCSSAIYPFRFTLEPVTLDSLAKYVIAESPAELSEADRALLDQVRDDAARANGGQEVRHVGRSSRGWRAPNRTSSGSSTSTSECRRCPRQG